MCLMRLYMSRSLLDQPLLHDAVEDLPALAVPLPKAQPSTRSCRVDVRVETLRKNHEKTGKFEERSPKSARNASSPAPPRPRLHDGKNMKPELEALSLSAEARHGPARRSPAACRCWGGPNPSPKAFEGGETPPKTCSAPRFLKVFKGKCHHFIIISSSKAG